MSKEAEVTRITEVRGKDGSTAYRIEGGKPGEGPSDFVVPKESFHESERAGKKEHQEQLKRWIEMDLAQRRG